jgi:ABC-type uncharacterized transport system involved in gliding motility auxiliary subunit/ABC-type transport system involved in multi-copper enzyme maturation permease subunit
MKNIWAVTKKELGSFFASPIAYVIIVVFSVLVGYFFYAILSWFNNQAMQMAQNPSYAQQININQMVYSPLFGNMIIVLLMILPLLTMRLFSEEKKSGTDELLFTSPLSLLEIGLGKYFASLVVLLAMLASSAVLSVFVFVHGNPEPLPILVGYLGLFLTGAAFVAFGVLFSAMTENQIISAVLSFGMLLFFWVLSWVSGSVGGFLRGLFEDISLLQHFENMTGGILDTNDVIYFLSLIGFALFMTNWVLHSKWWRQNIEKFQGRFSLWAYLYLELLFLTGVANFIWSGSTPLSILLVLIIIGGVGGLTVWSIRNLKQILFWANKLLIVFLVLGIAMLINYLGIDHHKRVDFTAAKIHSLSDQSVTVLKALKTDIVFKGFFREGNYGRAAMENLLKIYAYHSAKVHYEFIDPDKNPGLVKRYDVTQDGTTIIEAGDKESRITTTTEEDVTNALIKATRAQKKVIYFLEGHGEERVDESGDNGFSTAKTELEKLGYEVKKQSLALADRFPKDCALLVVPGPQKDLLPNEYETIRTYLKNGGRALFLIDPETATLLPIFLSDYGFKLENDVIIDTVSRLLGGDYFIPIVSEYESHPITDKFAYATFLPLARSVDVAGTKPEGATLTALAKTSQNSYAKIGFLLKTQMTLEDIAFTAGKDRRGPINIAVAGTYKFPAVPPAAPGTKPGEPAPAAPQPEAKEKEARVVVIGDSDFAKNNYYGMNGNGNFFLNVANWLTEESDLIAIQPKTQAPRTIQLTQAQGKFMGFFAIFLLSLPVRVLGVYVSVRRKSL